MSILLTIETGPEHEVAADNSTRTSYLIRDSQSLVVGRDRSSADIVLEADTALSRAHFRVTCTADSARLQDLGSSHGTLVNGQPVTEIDLSDGDHIAAAETRMLVEFVPSVAAAPAPVSETQVSAESASNDDAPRRRAITLRILQTVSRPGGQLQYCWLFATLLPEETVTLGRVAERSEIAIPDDSLMSGKHVEFSFARGQCRALDLNSSNGSSLNGRRFSNELLQHGDELQCGSTYVLVQFESDEDASRPRAEQTAGSLAISRGLRQEARLRSRGYQIVNTTPFPFAPLIGRIGFPGHSLTLIVKASMDLVPDGVMTPAEEQLLPTGDQPFPGDDDPACPPRYESDFAFFKPKTDVLVAGHCHAPGGEPVQQLDAAVNIGEVSHQITVHGERFWQLDRREWQATEPVPFTSLKLQSSHAYGGPEFEANPNGIGYYDQNLKPSDNPLPLARIVQAGAVPKSPGDRMEPVGFGPTGRWHGTRRSQLGTYDESWEQKRWPWFADDFDWEHFNAAPSPLQIDGYLNGDEEVVLTNLHSEHPELRSRLPGLRVRTFVNPSGEPFREVPAKLDTLWIDTDNDKSVLVWRGNAQVRSEECEEIRHVFILCQPLDEPLLSLNDCHARLLNELARRKSQFVPPPESPPEDAEANANAVDLNKEENDAEGVESVPGAEAAAAATEALSHDAEFQKLSYEIRAAQVAAGVDPAQFDKQVEAEIARLAKEWGLGGDTLPAGFEHKAATEFWNLQKQIHDAQVASGVEPIPLPPPPEKPTEEAVGEEPSGWTRKKVEAHHSSGGSFAGQKLSGLDLSGLDLSAADFKAAILSKTKLVGTKLAGTDFTLASLSDADLSEADLTGATLNHADFSAAVLHKSVLDRVDANGTIMAGAWLTGTSMQHATALRACFADADLTGAILSHSKLDNADFTKARLTRASLTNCSLVSARFESVSARDARFDFADMTKIRASESDCAMATFHQVSAPDSIWELANLIACDFTWAQLPRANFTKAVLKDARMSAANLTGARLTKSVMRRVLMNDANLFEANLQQADLRYANLTQSSLYGAEVFEALFENSIQDSVNRKMTKLEQRQTS